MTPPAAAAPGTPAGTKPGTRPAPGELTPADKRALREKARREFQAAERERLAAEKAAKTGAPAAGTKAAPGAAETPPPAELDARTDAQRQADAAVFLRGVVWPVASVLAWLFGWELGDLTDAMAKDDAASWVPLARRYRWLDLAFTWAGAPARLAGRVRELAHRRQAKPPAKETPAP